MNNNTQQVRAGIDERHGVVGTNAETYMNRSTSNVKNYEVSKKLSTTIGQIGKIRKVKTAVLVKNKIIQTIRKAK